MSETLAILHYSERPEHPPRAGTRGDVAAVLCGGPRVDAQQRADSQLGIALAAVAARFAGHDLRTLRLSTAPGCKPRWVAGPDFSISHAAGLVACAVFEDGAAVGCDIEAEQAVGARDLRLLLDDTERALLASGVLTPAVIWTRKEAALKWAGLGLRAVNEVRVTRQGVLVGGRVLHCRAAMLPGGVTVSVVGTHAGAGMVVRRHDALDLLRALPAVTVTASW